MLLAGRTHVGTYFALTIGRGGGPRPKEVSEKGNLETTPWGEKKIRGKTEKRWEVSYACREDLRAQERVG